MFIRFLRDYYLNANRMFESGETVDVDQQYGTRFITEGAAVLAYGNIDAQAVAPVCLAQWAIPVGIPSSGTIGNNGALSGITALQLTYNVPGLYLYFPASAIFAGSPAGFYWTVMSSTTAGTIYQEQWVSGVPQPPAAPTPWVTTGPGAYTQTTATTIDLSNVLMPGKSMGPNGSVWSVAVFTCSNSANTKTFGLKWNTTLTWTTAQTTAACLRVGYDVRNRGSEARQTSFPGSVVFGSSTGSMVYTTFDTSLDVALKWTGNLAAATEYILLESVAHILTPGM